MCSTASLPTNPANHYVSVVFTCMLCCCVRYVCVCVRVGVRVGVRVVCACVVCVV